MKEINKEIDELVEDIKNSELYKDYLHILKQVEDSEDINHLISEIKSLQQSAVNEEHQKHSSSVKELDKIIEEKLDELYNIPLYKDYICKANELNDLLNIIGGKFQDYFDHLNF